MLGKCSITDLHPQLMVLILCIPLKNLSLSPQDDHKNPAFRAWSHASRVTQQPPPLPSKNLKFTYKKTTNSLLDKGQKK